MNCVTVDAPPPVVRGVRLRALSGAEWLDSLRIQTPSRSPSPFASRDTVIKDCKSKDDARTPHEQTTEQSHDV